MIHSELLVLIHEHHEAVAIFFQAPLVKESTCHHAIGEGENAIVNGNEGACRMNDAKRPMSGWSYGLESTRVTRTASVSRVSSSYA